MERSSEEDRKYLFHQQVDWEQTMPEDMVRSNITADLLLRLTFCVSLCLAERGGNRADFCPIRMICVHIKSERVCAGLERLRKQGWHLDWLDCGVCGQLMVSAVVQSSLSLWWDVNIYEREVGEIKRTEEGVMGKLLHTALLVFLEQFEWFMRLKEQFRDIFKSYQCIIGIEYWTMN